MEHDAAAHAFAILGNPGRLAVLRLLMRFAPRGVRPTEMAKALALKQNTLSHHLADLTAAGLCRVDRQGRSLFYSVNLPMTEALIGYLAYDLGRGRPDLLPPIHPGPETHLTPVTVLFVCSANSARSLMAEALLRDLGTGRFAAFSAGTGPGPAPNPTALHILRQNGHAVADLHAKPLRALQETRTIAPDFVFTVCDAAAAEDGPPWPGLPIRAHWGLPDPVKATGSETERSLAFAQTYAALRRRIAAFVDLPLARLSRLSLQSHVDAIGILAPN